MGFIAEIQGWLNIHKSMCHSPYLQNKGEKSYDHLNWYKKNFEKIQHTFMIKTLSKPGKERNSST